MKKIDAQKIKKQLRGLIKKIGNRKTITVSKLFSLLGELEQ